jgi:type I restriction enzyme, R subunit
MRTRHALEQAVLWLFENDRTLRMPYDRSQRSPDAIRGF